MSGTEEEKPPELSEKTKWKALLRGQIGATCLDRLMKLVQLIDHKAQVMIFLNSIMIPVCINALEHETFKFSPMVSIITAVISILAAIICIYPKRRYRKKGDPNVNLMHFNDIGHMEKDEYIDLFLPKFNNPQKLSEMVVNDIYDTSRYSIIPKLKWLKASYVTFACGNMLAICIAFSEVF